MTDLKLTQAEQDLFKDSHIEAAYIAWRDDLLKTHGRHHADTDYPPASRKQFLMRIRALVQAGTI